METKEIINELRKKYKLSQSEFADKLFVTRQAVSRWECGKTTPSNDTLVTISRLFSVSVNYLLGDQEVFCQSCGMPLNKAIMSKEINGDINEDYCQWCYHDGNFAYESKEDLIDKVIPILIQQGFDETQAKSYLQNKIPNLRHWKEI